MNYFSRIANQSGLRYSRGTVKERRSTIAEPTSKHLSPIEVDETLLVAPSQPDQPSKNKRNTGQKKDVEEVSTKARDPKRIVKADRSDIVPMPAVPHEDAEKKPEVVETKLITNALVENVGSPHEQTANALPAKKGVVEPVTIKQTVSKKTQSASEPAHEVEERVLVEATESEKSSEDKIAHDTARKDYFSKTAEIIEHGDARAAQIHQILLREVQQWAADSPTESEISEVAVERVEPQITKQIVSPRFEQTQLIEEQNLSESKETSGLAEQTFELSIGSINVVIEDGKPKQPEPVPRANAQNTTQPGRREYSRLSRHYL